jgi:hypothetical protein
MQRRFITLGMKKSVSRFSWQGYGAFTVSASNARAFVNISRDKTNIIARERSG